MKKIVGVKVLEGDIIPIEYDLQHCICIKQLVYKNPLASKAVMATIIILKEEAKYFEEGKQYEFVIEDDKVINNYRVYIDGNNGNNLTKEEFDENFVEITEYRNNKIESIIK